MSCRRNPAACQRKKLSQLIAEANISARFRIFVRDLTEDYSTGSYSNHILTLQTGHPKRAPKARLGLSAVICGAITA